MDFEFFQLVHLLLALGGVGLTPNPTPPTVDASLEYAVADADLVVHLDAKSLLPNNVKQLQALPQAPDLAALPGLRTEIRRMIAEMETGRAAIRQMTGIDVVADLFDATVFVQLEPTVEKVNFLATVHGNFKPDVLQKVAAASGATISQGVLALPDQLAIALTPRGTLLVGTNTLVSARAAANWQAPARVRGSLLAKTAEVLSGQPVAAVTVGLRPTLRLLAQRQLGENFLTDLVQEHTFVALAVQRDGLGLWFDARSKAMTQRMSLLFEGIGEMMRAYALAPTAITKAALAALPSYQHHDKRIAALLRQQPRLLALANDWSGQGNVTVKVAQDPSTQRVTLRATSSNLAAMAPVGLFMVGAFVSLGRTAPMPPPAMLPAPPPPPARPLTAPRKAGSK